MQTVLVCHELTFTCVCLLCSACRSFFLVSLCDRERREITGDKPPDLSGFCGSHVNSTLYIFAGCDPAGYTNQVSLPRATFQSSSWASVFLKEQMPGVLLRESQSVVQQRNLDLWRHFHKVTLTCLFIYLTRKSLEVHYLFARDLRGVKKRAWLI